MALIQCRNCGKNISDTVKSCIHCGAPIIIENNKSNTPFTQEIRIEQPIKSSLNDTSISFDMMPLDKQIELEREFLASDRAAMKYKRFQIELTKLPWIRLMVTSVVVLMVYLFYTLSKESVNINYNTMNPIINVMIKMAVISLVACIILLYIVIIITVVRLKSIKFYVYKKKFQKWLKEKKNLDYSPIFAKESQKEIFDNIDLDVMKL